MARSGRKPPPGVGRAEAPVLGEGDGGGDDLEVDVAGLRGGEIGQEALQLGLAEHGMCGCADVCL